VNAPVVLGQDVLQGRDGNKARSSTAGRIVDQFHVRHSAGLIDVGRRPPTPIGIPAKREIISGITMGPNR